jgi:hypothetical protein
MRLPGRSPKGNAVDAEQTNIPDPRATEPLRALPREQENWLTPRNAPYEFSDEKRTFHYPVREEVKSRKASGGLLEEMILLANQGHDNYNNAYRCLSHCDCARAARTVAASSRTQMDRVTPPKLRHYQQADQASVCLFPRSLHGLCESFAYFAVKILLTAKFAKNCREEPKAGQAPPLPSPSVDARRWSSVDSRVRFFSLRRTNPETAERPHLDGCNQLSLPR